MGKASSFVAQWMRHRTVLLDVLDRIGDEHVQYRPWDKALSLSELVVHIAGTSKMFVNAVQTGLLVVPASGSRKADSMAETRDFVRTLTDETRSAMEALTDEQLEGIVDATKTFGFSAPGKVFLHTMREHEIHHKGQLFVYARMVGVEQLPFFVAR